MPMRGWGGGDGVGGGKPVRIPGSGRLEGSLAHEYVSCVFVFFSVIIIFWLYTLTLPVHARFYTYWQSLPSILNVTVHFETQGQWVLWQKSPGMWQFGKWAPPFWKSLCSPSLAQEMITAHRSLSQSTDSIHNFTMWQYPLFKENVSLFPQMSSTQ